MRNKSKSQCQQAVNTFTEEGQWLWWYQQKKTELVQEKVIWLSGQKAWIYLPLCVCYKVISFSGPQFAHPAVNTTLSPKNHLIVRISQDHRCGSQWNSGKPTESILTSKCKMECSATSWIFWEGRKDLCKFRDLMFLFRVDYPQISYFLNLLICSTKILESWTTGIPTSQAPFSLVTPGLGGPHGSFVCCFLFIYHIAVPVLPHK